MGPNLEKSWPYLLGVIVTAAWCWALHRPFPEPNDGLLSASGGAASVLIGFLATAKTVLLAIGETRVLRRLRTSGHLDLLYRYLYEALCAGILFLVVSIIGFFLNDEGGKSAFAFIWVLSASTTLTLFVRITNLLFKLLRWV